LGIGGTNYANQMSPMQVAETNIIQIAVGYSHSIILKNDGNAFTFGGNCV
jgi:alpha-tubulin suppressor-like RCC1 family protein